MIRFLSFLFGKPYETCKSCETLKQQLAFAQAEKREMLDTILGIVKPKVFEAPVQERLPVAQTSMLFSKRRAVLEARDREEAKILQSSTNLGRPDNLIQSNQSNQAASILKLETELGIDDSNSETEKAEVS